MVTKEDMETLEGSETEALAIMWCQLNRGDWPKGISNPEPFPQVYKPGGRRSLLMNWIHKKIGLKECLRVWNSERMSREEFEEWWKSSHGGRVRV